MPDLNAWLDSLRADSWGDDLEPALPVAMVRADLLLALPDTATVYRTSGTPRTRTAVYSLMPIYVQVDRETGSVAMDELNPGITLYIAIYPATYTLMKDDQVVHNGHTFEVDDLMDDNSPLAHKQVRMTKVDA